MAGRKSKKPKSQPGTKALQSSRSTNDTAMQPVHKSTTHFFSLPAEIRLMIWDLSLSDPRVVDVKLDAKPRDAWSSSIPNLLHVCHESRQTALNHYELAFPLVSSSKSKNADADGIPRVYFDYSKDILHFSSLPTDDWGLIDGITKNLFSTPLDYHQQQQRRLRDVKNLSLDIDTHWRRSNPHRFRLLHQIMMFFPALEQLLIMQDNRWDMYELEGKGQNMIEKVKETACKEMRLDVSPRERDFVDTFDKMIKEIQSSRRPWKVLQLKFVEHVRELA